MDLEEIREQILAEFNWIYDCIIDGDEIIVEEEYEMGEDEKNSDDCCDTARENGEMIIEKFQILEISKYYCHRGKYAIVELKMKSEQLPKEEVGSEEEYWEWYRSEQMKYKGD